MCLNLEQERALIKGKWEAEQEQLCALLVEMEWEACHTVEPPTDRSQCSLLGVLLYYQRQMSLININCVVSMNSLEQFEITKKQPTGNITVAIFK